MTGDDFLRIWRVFVLGMGAFDMGFALTIAWFYVHGHFKPGAYASTAHVLAITVSYVILCAGLWAFIFDRAVQGDPITWRLPLASVAWPLGIYALAKLLRRAHDTQVGGDDANR
jgi:hypothetical protein